MRMFFLVVWLALYMALSSVPVNAKTIDTVSGSAISSGIDGNSSYIQEEFENVTIQNFFSVYIIGVLAGLGCSTVLYIFGLGVGFFFSILKKYV